MSEEAARRLENHRYEGESFSEFALRIASILDERSTHDGRSVLERETDGPRMLSDEHVDELASRPPERADDELEG